MRVYLDQFCWVNLLAVRQGHPRGAGHEDSLLLLEAAVATGDVVLPLSEVHYIETANRRPFEKRRDLAALMLELSRGNRIAPFTALVRAELRCAIAAWFGSRVVPSEPRPFGLGADHAFGAPAIADLVAGLVERFGPRALSAAPILEWGAIARHAEHDIEKANDPRVTLEQMTSDEASRLERLRQLRRAGGWCTGERSRRVWSAQAYVETLDEFNAAFAEADIPAGRLFAQGADAMDAFLRDVPSLHAHYELGRLREQADSRPWHRNDLRDLDALSVATVYCDAVVTENSWCSHAVRSKLAHEHGTMITNDLRKLTDLILRTS